MLNNLCRIGMDMPKNRWWQWIAGGLLGLLLLTLFTRCSNIQNDIQGRAQEQLDGNGMGWATADLEKRGGRDAWLSGEAPSEAAQTQAVDTVQNLYGTRVVDHDMTLKQYVSSTLDLKLGEDDKVVLSGTMPDQATIDDAVSQVQSVYGADNVTNNLVTSDSARKPVWLAGVAGLLPALVATRNVALSADDDAVKISGDVETAALRDENLGLMDKTFGDKLQAAIEVVKTGPTEEELAAIAAEKARIAAEAEAARKAEEERLAAEAEAARKAEEEKARLAAEAADRKAKAVEKARLAAAAAATALAARNAQAAEAAEAAEAARIAAEAEQARLAAEAAAKQRQMMATQMHNMMMANRRKIIIVQPMFPVKYDAENMPAMTQQVNQNGHMIMNCEQALNRLVGNNPAPFADDSADMQEDSQALFGQLNMQIRYCGGLVKQSNAQINVAAAADNADLGQQRAQAAIDQLQNNFGIPAGVLSVNEEPGEMSGDTQLHFTIKQ